MSPQTRYIYPYIIAIIYVYVWLCVYSNVSPALATVATVNLLYAVLLVFVAQVFLPGCAIFVQFPFVHLLL